MGLACHAVVERSAYPCVFQDRELRLYFMVPAGTSEFVIQSKDAASRLGILPSRLHVRVTVRRGNVIREEAKVDRSPVKGSNAASSGSLPRDADRGAGSDREAESEPPPGE
jgi:hypothetical protein